jgi:hypothetical protein
MPTNRRRRAHTIVGDRITPEVVEAWRVGDWHGLNRLLGVKPWETSPFDIDEDGEILRAPLIAIPDDWSRDEKRAVRLRRALLEICPPGRVGRHGDPLGSAEEPVD